MQRSFKIQCLAMGDDTMTTNNKELVTRQDMDAAQPADSAERQYRVPAADIYETRDAYVLMLDMPGVSRERIRVRVEHGELVVRADAAPLTGPDVVILHREHVADGYDRAFSLGEDVDLNNIDAQFEHGVLTMKLFKSERVKAREIVVR
jgi:HSP20 family protein